MAARCDCDGVYGVLLVLLCLCCCGCDCCYCCLCVGVVFVYVCGGGGRVCVIGCVVDVYMCLGVSHRVVGYVLLMLMRLLGLLDVSLLMLCWWLGSSQVAL